jgi:PPE-repeat protein
MVLSFAAIPPEITSSLIYSGAGSAPLMAAATAYANLAAEVSSTATQWESIVSLLTSEQWTGGGSTAAAAAAQPIVTYLTETASTLEQASAQATASAAAFEAVFAAVVPPQVVIANRTLQASLLPLAIIPTVAAEIAALDAQYAEFWAQDAAAMAAYQAASAAAGTLTPVTPLTSTTNPAAAATVDNAALAGNTANGTVQALASPLSDAFTLPDANSNLLDSIDNFLGTPSVFNAINGGVNTAAWFTMITIPTAVSLGHTLGAVPAIAVGDVAPDGVAGITEGTMVGTVAPVGGLGGVSGVGTAASAAVGQASTVGRLSVPATWSAAAPATQAASAAAPLEGSGWTVASEAAEPVTAMPGMPGMAAAAKGAGAYGSGPRYGIKPIVMPKQVVV